MSEFPKYAEMRSQGASARNVYLAAQADGLDAIQTIRMLRQVFGLSLVEAKQVTGAADVWSAKQEVTPGATVYWEGWTADDGAYFMQARVRDIVEGTASLEGHRKFRIASDREVVEVPVEGSKDTLMRVSYLERSLLDRLEDFLRFLDNAARASPGREEERRAV